MAENTPAKHLEPYKWQPGKSANPAGRPKGAKNKLGEAFVQALHEDFLVHGEAVIATVRAEKPDQYLKVIASLVPKDVNFNLNNESEMSDDEIRDRIRDLANRIAPFLGGTGETGERAEAQGGAGQPSSLH